MATVRISSSVHARNIRMAISPRLATSTLFIVCLSTMFYLSHIYILSNLFELFSIVHFLIGYFLLRCLKSRSEEHTSELQSRGHLVCRLLLQKKKKTILANYGHVKR